MTFIFTHLIRVTFEMKFELPSFEFSMLMVGPFHIPVPKLTTPKLTATFMPVPSVPDKNP